MRRKKKQLLYLFFIFLSGLWILPAILNMDGVLFHPKAAFSDILISHWPNLHFVREAWRTWGEFPLWNPLILSGSPLVADPLFGIWYPPNWLALLLPTPLAFNLLFWVHLAWAGIGMYTWLRSEIQSWGGALIAGIAFSGTTKLIGHIALGHLGLVCAIAWTPWLLLISKRTLESIGSQDKRWTRNVSLTGAMVALIFFADPRWILPAAILVGLFALRHVYSYDDRKTYFTMEAGLKLLLGLMIALGLAAGSILPLIEFTSLSTRSNLTFQELTELSLPISNIVGILIPSYAGWPETLTYLGLIVVGLALVAAVGRGKGWTFWASVAVISLLLALGDQNPIYHLLYKIIPGFKFIRVPARFFFLCTFSVSVLAGIGFDLMYNTDETSSNVKIIRLVAVGYCALLIAIAIGVWILTRTSPHPFSKPSIHMVMAGILFISLGLLSLRKGKSVNLGVALWSGVIILDLFIMNQSMLVLQTQESILSKISDTQSALIHKDGMERIFSPSYAVPQESSLVGQIQLADGVNPLQLRSYWNFMSVVIGYDKNQYSVTLPPFPDGQLTDPRYTTIDADALGLLNVRTIVSSYPLESPDLELNNRNGDFYVYRNSSFRPRAWIELNTGEDSPVWKEVESIEWSPNQIFIQARGPGKLVLSEMHYPGWQATINGQQTVITPYQDLLRSVQLTDGLNMVEFRYKPLTVILGLGITTLTLLLVAILWWRK